MFRVNPNYGARYGIGDGWFQEREDYLKKLLRD